MTSRVAAGITGYDVIMAQVRQTNTGLDTEEKRHLVALGSTFMALSVAITFIERMLSINDNPDPDWIVSNDPDSRRNFHDVLMRGIHRMTGLPNIPVHERRSERQFFLDEGYLRVATQLGTDLLFSAVSSSGYGEWFEGNARLTEGDKVLNMQGSVRNSVLITAPVVGNHALGSIMNGLTRRESRPLT